MTISNTASSVKVLGNGAQTVFNYGFEIAAGAEYALYYEDANGNITLLNPATYQVSGIGNATGGTFTYPVSSGVSPIASGTSLTLLRQTPQQQQTSLGNQGAYYPQVVEGALDWIVMQIQDLSRQVGQTLHGPGVDAAVAPLPSAPQRANGQLWFDANGNPTIATAVLPTAQVSAAMADVLIAASTALALEALGVNATMLPVLASATVAAALEALGVATDMVPVLDGTAGPAAAFEALGVSNAVAAPFAQTTLDGLLAALGAVTSKAFTSGDIGTANDWLTAFQTAAGGPGFGDLEYAAMGILTNTNPSSLYGIIGGSQTLYSIMDRDFVGTAGFALNNSPTYGTNAWGVYGEAHQLTTVTGATYGAEFDVRTTAQYTAIDPYTTKAQQTVAVQVASGAGFTGAQFNNSAAINIQNNGAQFGIGINFGYESLAGDTGSSGAAIAMALGYGHSLQWYAGSGVGTSRISCFATTTAEAMGLNFNQGYLDFTNSNGVPALQVRNVAAAANYIAVYPWTAGGAPTLTVDGSDTNINIALLGKGTGLLQYGTYTALAISQAGYIPIYDSSGTLRRLLVG